MKHAIFIILVLLLLPGAHALECTLKNSACIGSEVCIIKLSDTTGAHAEECTQSNYAHYLCCDDTVYILSTAYSDSCATGGGVLSLFAQTDSHVEEYPSLNYANDVCVSTGATDIVTCMYTDFACDAGYTCLLSMSDATNAHLANCTGIGSYTKKICCKIGTISTITITSPTNTTYTETNLLNLNVSCHDSGSGCNQSSWRFSINNGINYTFLPNTTLTSKMGSNKLTVWIKNNAGIWDSSTVYYTIYSTKWEDDFTEGEGISASENITIADGTIRPKKIKNMAWWNDSWTGVKQINISNIAGDLANYQLRIIHNFSQEYSAGYVQQYCSDTRFTLENGTELPYWTEACNLSYSDNATFWLKIPFLKNDAITSVYMYYGNPSAGTQSNQSVVCPGGSPDEYCYEFYDDFSSSTFTSYQNRITGGCTGSCTTGDNMAGMNIKSTAYYTVPYGSFIDTGSTGFCGDAGLVKELTLPDTTANISISFYIRGWGANWASSRGFVIERDGYGYGPKACNQGQTYYWLACASRSGNGCGSPIDPETGLTYTPPTITGNWQGFTRDISQFSGKTLRLRMLTHDYSCHWCNMGDHPQDLWVDDIRIRKYAFPEPTISIIDTETVKSAEVSSLQITPLNLIVWDKFNAVNTTPSGASITYNILRASDEAILCSGLTGNNDSISLCAGSTPSLKLYAQLIASTATPILYNWNVTWITPGHLANGTINGTVTDDSGTPLANVNIIASDGTNTYQNTTNALGEYTANNIIPSVYTVTASKPGFVQNTTSGIVVSPSSTITVNSVFSRVPQTIVSRDAIVYFKTEKDPVVMNIGEKLRMPVIIKNPSNDYALVSVHIGSPDTTFRNFVHFENHDIYSRDINITMKPNQEKVIFAEILAGKIGSCEIVIGPDSIYENKYDTKRITVINKNAGIFAQTPGMAWSGVILVLAIAAALLLARNKNPKKTKK